MEGFGKLNLIHFLDFYLMFFFFVGTWRRIDQYRNAVQLVFTGPGRWPHLLQLVRQYRTIFMTWATVAPALLALTLLVVQLVASRLVWPEAGEPPDGLTVSRLAANWLGLLFVVPLAVGMLLLDLYTVVRVGEVPRAEMEKYFDQAEYWLRSGTAHVVRVFTLGYINPRKMVADEVQKALVDASSLLNNTLWWVCAQTGLRVACGLSLWLTWAFAA